MLAVIFLLAQNAEALFNEASSALARGDYAGAESGFQRVLKMEPRSVAALGNLGVTYSRMERPVDAVRVYRQALALAPRENGLKLNLALALMKLDDHASAKKLLVELPVTRQTLELLATARMYTGEVAQAVAMLEPLSASQPGTDYLLALGYLKLGRRDEALRVMERMFAQLPAAQAHFLAGRAWYENALFEKALEAFEKAQSSDATLPGIETELGKTLVSLRRPDEAESWLRKALERNPGDLEAAYFLGAQQVQDGRAAEGAPLLERVAQARPELWGTAYYLGKAKLALGQPAAAVPLLQRAAKASPSENSVQYQLARALQAAGRVAEAKVIFDKLRGRSTTEPAILR